MDTLGPSQCDLIGEQSTISTNGTMMLLMRLLWFSEVVYYSVVVDPYMDVLVY